MIAHYHQFKSHAIAVSLYHIITLHKMAQQRTCNWLPEVCKGLAGGTQSSEGCNGCLVSQKADVAQQQRFGGKEVWQLIRDMQWTCRGLIPQRTGNIKDEGEPCTSVDVKEQWWRWHFNGTLNVESHFNQVELDMIMNEATASRVTITGEVSGGWWQPKNGRLVKAQESYQK